MGPFKCYVTQWGGGGVSFPGKKRYEGVRFNVISVTRGWVGVKFPGKKRYVTLEWPLCACMMRALGMSIDASTYASFTFCLTFDLLKLYYLLCA